MLVYRIPSQPSKLRLQVWRKLQRLGVLYLQDAVCVLPDQPELEENLQYIAQSILEMGGQSFLMRAENLNPYSHDHIVEGFRAQADERLAEISKRLALVDVEGDAEQAEEALKNERISFLRANRLSYFGSLREHDVEQELEQLKTALNRHHHIDHQRSES